MAQTGDCTGITATYCPVHGGCTCEVGRDGTPTLDDDGCHLHDSQSEHGEGPDENERLRAVADAARGLDLEGVHVSAAPAHPDRCAACRLPWPCPTRRVLVALERL